MKLLILSDIHSNIECLHAIWNKEGDADLIVAAGDYVDYGTDPCAVINWMQSHHVCGVRGNHDDRILDLWRNGNFADVPPSAFGWAHHNCLRLCGKDIAYLDGLPSIHCFQADGIAYLMAHRCGSGYETIESQYHFDRYWAEHFNLPGCAGMERRMIFGHTHRQMAVRLENGLWINPGSASYRRQDDPDKTAHYAMVDGGIIRFERIPYNRRPLFQEAVRCRSRMNPDEWHVADFFFGWREEDGPYFEQSEQ